MARLAMTSVKLTAAVFKLLAVLLVFALSSKRARGQHDTVKCQTLAFELFAFAKPSSSIDCKQACDERFVVLNKMLYEAFDGVNLLSSSSNSVKTRADARGIFWIDQCVAWLRYCFRQRAPMLTVDENALDLQHSASTYPALTCLCRSVFLLMQVRSPAKKNEVDCERKKICTRLTGRLNLEHYGNWSCKNDIFVIDVSCSIPVPICLCCWRKSNHHKPGPCPDFPELKKLMNEPFVLGDQEWEAYDLHGAPQSEEGFPRGTVLSPQRLACPVKQEGLSRFKAASLQFHTFEKPACAQVGSCAAKSLGASQMHSHFEAISEARDRTHQLQECLRPPQKQKNKRKATATADASCSISALALIGQPQNDLAIHGSQFSEAYPSPFTTMDDNEPFFGSEFVFARASSGQGNSMGSESSGIDPENLHFSQVFAEPSEIVDEHAAMALDPDNLQFNQYRSAAGSAAATEIIPPADQSNFDDSIEDKETSQTVLEAVP